MAGPILKMNVQCDRVDLGFKKILEEYAKIKKKPFVKVGIQGASGQAVKKQRKQDGSVEDNHQGLRLVIVAAVHEFGDPEHNIPRRSFIRDTVAAKAKEWQVFAVQLHQKILMGKLTTEEALGLLGERIQADIQAHFLENDWPRLSVRAYEEREGKSGHRPPSRDAKSGKWRDHNPLVDTGQLRRGIRWKIVLDPEGEAA